MFLLAILFVLQSPSREEIAASSPSPGSTSAPPLPSVTASIGPTPATTASPTATPYPSPNATASPNGPSPSPGDAGEISTCSDSASIGLTSEWVDGRFIVREIGITVPTAACDGVSAQVVLLDQERGVLLRRTGTIASQQLLFNVLSDDIASLLVRGTAIELSDPGTVPVSGSAKASLNLEIVGTLGGILEDLSFRATGASLSTRTVASLSINDDVKQTLVGDDGKVLLQATLAPRSIGSFIITATAGSSRGALQRRAFVTVDASRHIVVLIRDYDAWQRNHGTNALPEPPTIGRGATILVAEDGHLVYLDERASTSNWAAQLGSATDTLARPSTLFGGLLAGIIVALLGLAVGLLIDLAKRAIRRQFDAWVARFRLPSFTDRLPAYLGFRIDALPFLLTGQVVAALNAPLERIPPFDQFVQGALYGVVGIVLVNEFTRLPRILFMRRRWRDSGVFYGRWVSILLALGALVVSHLLNVVPGIIVGIFAARRFHLEVGDDDDAEITWQSSLLTVAAALAAWLAMDTFTQLLPDPQSPIRTIGDGVLITILVAGSHGLLASLVNPTESGSVALRRANLGRWLLSVALASTLVAGIIATGGAAEELFGPDASLPQLAGLTCIAITIGAAALLATRRYEARMANG